MLNANLIGILKWRNGGKMPRCSDPVCKQRAFRLGDYIVSIRGKRRSHYYHLKCEQDSRY